MGVEYCMVFWYVRGIEPENNGVDRVEMIDTMDNCGLL